MLSTVVVVNADNVAQHELLVWDHCTNCAVARFQQATTTVEEEDS